MVRATPGRTQADMPDGPKDRPLPETQGFSGGSVHGNFRIEEAIGHGGMGIVYRAVDTRLDRAVALKFLPPFLSADESSQRRFLAEARAASALDHPNICTIHDVGRSPDGHSFIAMALYDGDTLKQKMSDGPLPVDRALGYARQIASGLEKAHAAGIVHRDIKPANIMVTGDGIVKILDFGLAKLGDLGLTQSGSVPGTLKYMSPEHTEGEDVDARSDLWSLGVILYEMLAGTHPFGSGRASAIAYAIHNEEPEPLASVNPEVSADVALIVGGLLRKDREERYRTATALLADLDRTGISGGGITGPTRGRPLTGAVRRRSLARRLAVGAGAALAVGAISFPLIRDALSPRSTGPTQRQYLAVLPVTSVTGDPNDEVLASGLTFSLTSMLVSLVPEGGQLLVVPASEVSGQRVTNVEEAHEIFGVDGVVSAHFNRDPEGRGVVRLELIQPDPVAVMGNATLPGPDDAGFQSEVLQALANLVGLREGRAGEALLVSAPARSEAYAEYLEGRGHLQRSDLAGSLESAIAAFRRATEIDPGYALAYAGLCEAQFQLFRLTADRAWTEDAIESCDLAADLASDQAEVLTSVGALLLQTGEPERALRRLREAEAIDPNNPDVHRWLGRYYETRAMGEETVAAYERAIGLQPDSWIYHSELAVWYAYNGQPEKGYERYEIIRQLTPDNYLGYNGLGFTSILLGDFDAALSYFSQSIERRPNPIAYRNIGYLRLLENDWEGAVSALETGLSISETDWYSWRWLGHARYWLGERELARAAWERMVDLTTPLVQVNPDEIDYRLGLAEGLVLLGERLDGERHLSMALLRDFSWDYQPFYAARIFEMLDQRAAALQLVKEALEAGFRPRAVEADPWLADLRDDERWPAIRDAHAVSPR